jgi:hypothetical protein
MCGVHLYAPGRTPTMPRATHSHARNGTCMMNRSCSDRNSWHPRDQEGEGGEYFIKQTKKRKKVDPTTATATASDMLFINSNISCHDPT